MIVKSMPVGQIGTNCYLFGDEAAGVCALVDPGDQPRDLAKMVQDTGLKLTHIFLTHGHFDHTLAAPSLCQLFPDVVVYVHEEEVDPTGRPDNYMQFSPVPGMQHYKEGDVITVGTLAVKVMNTPGHSPGSVVLQVEDCLFSGDTLFLRSCGRTDFYNGSFALMQQSLKRLHDLPGDFKVYPGHEGATTLEAERNGNPYMKEAVKALS